MTAKDVRAELAKRAGKTSAQFAARFFKTYDGGYAAGDKFLGLKVPVVRLVCKKYANLPLGEIEKLLADPIHEHRLAGLIVLVDQFKKSDQAAQKRIYDFYMAHLAGVNNWDLVDVSCPTIVGGYLLDKPRGVLYKLARSKDLWLRRVAIVGTYGFIRENDLNDTFNISEILINDKEDLIHKAVGWMLREAGKRDHAALLEFLDRHAHELPRTALRYSIEHLPAEQKIHYMQLKSPGRAMPEAVDL